MRAKKSETILAIMGDIGTEQGTQLVLRMPTHVQLYLAVQSYWQLSETVTV